MRVWAICLWLVVACGGATATKSKVSEPEIGEDIDPKVASRDAKGLVEEIANAVRNSNTDALLPTVLDDLIVLGPTGKDSYQNRSDAVVALRNMLDKKRSGFELVIGKPVIGIAPGGHSTWQMFNLNVGDDSYIATAITHEQGEIARLAVLYISQSLDDKKLKRAIKREETTAPAAEFGATAGNARASAAEKELAKVFSDSLADVTQWRDDLLAASETGSAILIGPNLSTLGTGKGLKKFLKTWLSAEPEYTLVGKPVAHIAADGNLAWVTATVTFAQVKQDPMALRLFAVYVREEEAWRLTALHQGVAVDATSSK